MSPENEETRNGATGGGDAAPFEAEVKWYNARKGFGFVLGPDGNDVFFHASALTEAGIEPPTTGDKLVVEIGTDRQGRRLVSRILERKAGEGGAGAAGGGAGFGAPRRSFGGPGGGWGERPPRRDFAERPPRRDFGAGTGGAGGWGERPPRRDFGGGGFGAGGRFGAGSRGAGGWGERPPPRRDFARDEGGPTYSLSGTVKWFDQVRGFGFVTPDDGGQDVFLHSSVLHRAGKHDIQQGQKVSLEVRDGQRGRQAVTIKE